VVGGSFFETVPAGGDAYVLKSILHDWEDADCVRILERCRRAMTDEAALLVIERELDPPNAHPDGKFSDLNMLVGPGGRERTPEEYAVLFAVAGFRFVTFTPSDMAAGVFEGRRFWIITAPENAASAAGIAKAGFAPVSDLAFGADHGPASQGLGTERARMGAAILGVPLFEAVRDGRVVSPCWRCVIAANQAAAASAACWPIQDGVTCTCT
jgi:hypothetical protein